MKLNLKQNIIIISVIISIILLLFLYNKKELFLNKSKFDYIITIGCFDKLHKGHIKLLNTIKSQCKKLIIGIHDNSSITKIKNIKDIQDFSIRKNNIKEYAYDIFDIYDSNPTQYIKDYIEKHKLYLEKNICYMRADDNLNFPGKKYISSIMPIIYIPYTKNISSTNLRDKTSKIGTLNYLLETISFILKKNNIPHYIDCGTLLGCVRDNEIMPKDTDIDITIHLSSWDKLKSINFTNYDLVVSRILSGYPDKDDGNMISIKTKHNNFYCDIYANPAFPLLTEKTLNGIKYPIPIEPELYLSMLYGNSWNTPSNTHANTKYHRNLGLVNSKYKTNWDLKYKIYDCKF